MSTPISLAAPFKKSLGAVSHAWLACSLIAVLVAYAAGQTDPTALFPQPTRVDAEKPFNLEVLSFRWNCGTTYSHINSSRGNRLYISFLATEDPVAICPAIHKPYGPKAAINAMPAGRYDVHVGLLLPCHVSEFPCDAPVKQERVGFLTVGPQESADWFASPVTAAAGRPFDFRVLSDRYGNCHTRFEHTNLEVRDGRIVASFVIKTDTTIDCITDIRPHGPAFPMEALPAGKYPVDVIEIPACVYQNPICPWLPPDDVARTVDTLRVSGTTSLPTPARGAAGRAGARLERGRVKLEGAPTKNVQGRVLGVDKP